MYRDYSESESMTWADEDVDIVIAAWTDRQIERRALLMALMGCTKAAQGARRPWWSRRSARPANAKLLQLCGGPGLDPLSVSR